MGITFSYRGWGIAFFAVCILRGSGLLFAQPADSLEARLEGAEGIERIEMLSALTEAYQRSNPARAIELGREALVLLEQYPDANLESEILYQKGRAHMWLGEYDSTRAHALQLEEVATAAGYPKGLAESANLLGTSHALRGEFKQALGHFIRAQEQWEGTDDLRGLGNALNNIGIVQMRMGNYDESLDYYLRALAIWEEIGDPEGLSRVLNNTGNVYRELGSHEEALTFYERGLALKEEIGDRRGMALALNNIGIIHIDLGRFDEGLGYYERALEIFEEAGDRNNTGRTLNNISEVYSGKGDHGRALEYADRSLAIRQELGDKRGTAIAYNNLGNISRNLGEEEQALESYRLGLAMAEEVGEQRLVRDILKSISGIHEGRGEYAEALEAYKGFKAAHDSLFNAESQSVIAELQARYKTQEQQQQIASLEYQREIQGLWRNLLIAGLAGMGVIAFLMYSRYRIKHRAHRKLEQAHEELKDMQVQLIQQEKMASLGQLTAGIAHELKNPLNFVTNFAGLSEELLEELVEKLKNGDRETAEELAEDLLANNRKIGEHGQRADSIIRSMMQHASGSKGKREKTDLNRLVSDHIELAYNGKRAQVSDLQVEIERNLDDNLPEVELVPQEIGRVLLNLLSNALDAVREKELSTEGKFEPRVTVTTRRAGRNVEIRVEDNGPGLPGELRDKIFEPFFTTKPTGQGTGLGLSLSYDIVTKGHGGSMVVESEDGEGAAFIITLPAGSSN